MKKTISKIMLLLSILFLAGAVVLVATVLAGNFFHEFEQLVLLLCVAFFGFFLGLYRIIGLMEK